jgi:hypothetical protein
VNKTVLCRQDGWSPEQGADAKAFDAFEAFKAGPRGAEAGGEERPEEQVREGILNGI